MEKVAQKFQETGKINIGKRHLDFESTANLVNKQIDAYIKDARALQKSPKTIGRYLDRAELLIKNEADIRRVFGQISENSVTKDVKDLLAKEQPEGVRKLLQEILDKPEDLRYNRVERTLQRIDCIQSMCNKNFSRETYKKALLEKDAVLSGRIVELLAAKIDPKTADKKTIQKAIENMIKQCGFSGEDDSIVKAVLCDTDTFGDDVAKLTQKVYKDIAKGYKELVENSYKGFNQFTKIGVGVFITLPITCTALNWVYPRFMDIFFPSLSGRDEKKPEQAQKIGGNK